MAVGSPSRFCAAAGNEWGSCRALQRLPGIDQVLYAHMPRAAQHRHASLLLLLPLLLGRGGSAATAAAAGPAPWSRGQVQLAEGLRGQALLPLPVRPAHKAQPRSAADRGEQQPLPASSFGMITVQQSCGRLQPRLCTLPPASQAGHKNMLHLWVATSHARSWSTGRAFSALQANYSN